MERFETGVPCLYDRVEVFLGLSLRLCRREQVRVPEWVSLAVCCARFSGCYIMFQGLGCFAASHSSCFCSRVVVGGGPRTSGFYADTRVSGRSYCFSGGAVIFGVT